MLLKEIDKLCRSFIRNKINEDLGLHYVSWNNLCEPLGNGGRGLHSCSRKVGTLRAKSAWKYTQDKDSLLHKTLFLKYGSIWEYSAYMLSTWQ